MQKGFISITVIIVVVLGATLVTGGGFAAYKYAQVVQEKQMIETELVAIKDKEIADLKEQLAMNQEDATSTTEVVIEEEVETNVEPEIKEVVRTVTEYVPVEVPVTQAPTVDDAVGEVMAPSPETDLDIDLKVINVEEFLNEDDYSIRITWQTSVNADSRLALKDDQTYSSENSDSKQHSVEIVALPASEKFSYEIIAEVGDAKDSHFGNFQAPREFEVTFEQEEGEDECTTITVQDTAGYPLANTPVRLGGTYSASTSMNFLGERVEEPTNNRGEIEYCDPVERFFVQNLETRDIYFDSR
jgi:hypothetical protein